MDVVDFQLKLIDISIAIGSAFDHFYTVI